MAHAGGRPLKQSWPPCAVCGDPNGAPPRRGHTPQRTSGRRFGIDGQLCRKCYRRLQNGDDRRKAETTGQPKPRRISQLETLAGAVLAVRDALGQRDMTTANERLRLAVQLAETAIAPR